MKRGIAWSGLGICILMRLHGVGSEQTYYAPGELHYAHLDYMGVLDKMKITQISEEIVKDVNIRIRQTEGLREEHGNHLLYEIGTMLGQIKEKYKRQFEMYRQMYNKFHDISSFTSPEDNHFRPLHYFLVLEFIVAKQLEIEQLVEMVLKVPKQELFLYTPPPQKILVASSYVRHLRTRDPRHPEEPGEFLGGPSQEAVEQEIIRMAKEERLKMKYRAEYMKRHRNNVVKRK